MSTDKNAVVLTRKLRNRTITTILNPDQGIPKRKGFSATGTLKTDKSGNLEAEKSNAEQKILQELNQKVASNALILDCIFGFSSFEDIKSFRLVCRQWSEIAIPFVKNLCVISFKRPLRSLQCFNQRFRNSQLGTEFAAVKLTHARKEGRRLGRRWSVIRRRNWWKLDEFTLLLKDHKTGMEELTIDSICVQDYDYSDSFDLTPYLGPSLFKLNIHGMRKMSISTNRCTSIKFLSLRNCILVFSNEIKINPIELTLKNVVIKRNGNAQASSLNEFVNFDKLECLSLDGCTIEDHDFENLSLHFRDPITVKNVYLSCGRNRLDFEKAKWKVTEKLSLLKADFSIRNEMEFSNLEFEDARLDLAVLPRNLKTLKISENAITRVMCTNPISFPELEFLHLSTKAMPRGFRAFLPRGLELDKISHFNNCENLKTIMLSLHKSPIDFPPEECKVDISLLPRSVRKLCIYGDIRFFGKPGSFLLEQLNVRQSDQYSLNSILSVFRGEVLAVDLRCQTYSDSTIASVFQTVLDISEKPFDSIAVAFSHNNHSSKFNASQLSKCTDKMSEYYIFTNEFGKAISESRFEEFFAFAERMRKK